jgi:hypothetical protein
MSSGLFVQDSGFEMAANLALVSAAKSFTGRQMLNPRCPPET